MFSDPSWCAIRVPLNTPLFRMCWANHVGASILKPVAKEQRARNLFGAEGSVNERTDLAHHLQAASVHKFPKTVCIWNSMYHSKRKIKHRGLFRIILRRLLAMSNLGGEMACNYTWYARSCRSSTAWFEVTMRASMFSVVSPPRLHLATICLN